MNLVNGKILDAKACDDVVEHLGQRILDTLSKGRLDPYCVVEACDKVVKRLNEDQYVAAMTKLGIDEKIGRRYINEAKMMLCKKSLLHRLKIELGEGFQNPVTFRPIYKEGAVTQAILPLGVLLHIAAGNADGLPAFSVLEGLLTGNINILKLPSEEGGMSVFLLQELIKAEPKLADYIYVFDYSSKDIEQIDTLIAVANGVVIWGGKEAVGALRKRIPLNITLIEWGHKTSFAYVTQKGITPKGLKGLAKTIVTTGQLLCSSPQGIFLDTDDMNQVDDFCQRFLPILDDAMRQEGLDMGIGIKSQVGLMLYAEELEGSYNGSRVFRGEYTSLIAYPDQVLDTAIQFGNAWVKPLPKNQVLSTLWPYKNYLQTVGLLCGRSELKALADIFFSTGIVRVCLGENMSQTYCGAPHDGEFPLRRYTKVADIDT